MADYSGSYATPRADLGEALIEYKRDGEGGFITSKILPTLAVPKKTATFSAFTRGSILLSADVKRAPRGKYNRVEGQAADHTYDCQNYGIEQAIDDSERQFFSNDFDSDLMALMMAMGRIKRAQEIRTAAALFSTSKFTGSNYDDYSSTAPWTNVSTDVVGQVLDAKEASRRQTGLSPNTMVVGRPVFNLLKKNQDIKNRRNVTIVLSEQEQTDSMREIFGVEQFLIADEVYNSAAEGATASVTDIWAKQYCLLAYCAKPGAPLSEPSLGRLIQWDFLPENQVTSYREEKIRSDIIRVEHFVHEFIYDPAYGHLLKVQT